MECGIKYRLLEIGYKLYFIYISFNICKCRPPLYYGFRVDNKIAKCVIHGDKEAKIVLDATLDKGNVTEADCRDRIFPVKSNSFEINVLYFM